jgi:hypothetical protein
MDCRLIVWTHKDMMVRGSRRAARWSTGSCRVALYCQLLKCSKGIAVRGRIEAKHHALLTMSSLATISPHRFSIIDRNLERRKVACDIGRDRFAAQKT